MAENNNKARPATKTAMFQALAESTGLSRKQVASFFDEFANYLRHQLSKKGPGIVTIPGLLKIKRVHKPATKPRQGRNPKTGEPMTIAAKPARTVVKALALKALKEMVAKGAAGAPGK
jgi:nucleoid DNA-binding protein